MNLGTLKQKKHSHVHFTTELLYEIFSILLSNRKKTVYFILPTLVLDSLWHLGPGRISSNEKVGSLVSCGQCRHRVLTFRRTRSRATIFSRSKKHIGLYRPISQSRTFQKTVFLPSLIVPVLHRTLF